MAGCLHAGSRASHPAGLSARRSGDRTDGGHFLPPAHLQSHSHFRSHRCGQPLRRVQADFQRVPLWAQEPTLPLDGILPAAWGTHCRQLHAAKLPAGNKSLVVSILGGHVGSGRSPHTFNCPSRVHTRGLNTVVTPATHFKCSSHMGPAATTLDSKYGERVQKVLQAVLV